MQLLDSGTWKILKIEFIDESPEFKSLCVLVELNSRDKIKNNKRSDVSLYDVDLIVSTK